VIDRRTLFKALGAGASVSIAGGAITGCTDRPTGSDRDPNVVRLWGIWASDADVEAEVVEAFTSENPDITVEVSQVPSNGEGDASSVITVSAGSGEGSFCPYVPTETNDNTVKKAYFIGESIMIVCLIWTMR